MYLFSLFNAKGLNAVVEDEQCLILISRSLSDEPIVRQSPVKPIKGNFVTDATGEEVYRYTFVEPYRSYLPRVYCVELEMISEEEMEIIKRDKEIQDQKDLTFSF